MYTCVSTFVHTLYTIYMCVVCYSNLMRHLTSTLFLVLAICESYGTSIHWLKLLAAAEHSTVPEVVQSSVPSAKGPGAML